MISAQTPPGSTDLSAIRAKVAHLHGQQYWRSLDELAQTQEFQDMLQREFPADASEWRDEVSRREFLKLASASLVMAGMTACTKQPVQQILPYVKQPDLMVLGEPLYYATSMVLGGFATGVLVKSREGHPIKVEGNPEHPSSLGGSSIWMQASLLDLYDPDRSQAVAYHGDVSSWTLFLADVRNLLTELKTTRGAGLHFLTETVTSPTLATQLRALLKRYPQAKWHQFDPVSRDCVREGAKLAFGERLEAHYHLDKANVILALESDFLYTHPDRLRYTRQFSDGRRVSNGRPQMNRLYVLESTPTVTGTMADHRLPLSSAEIEEFTRTLAGRLGAPIAASQTRFAAPASHWLEVLLRDLEANRGASLIIAGEWQPPSVHVLAHFLNHALGNVGKTVHYTDSAEAEPINQLDSLRELTQDMKSGRVDTLFILGGNPVYTAPSDFAFGEGLDRVKRSVHLGLELDETAAHCTWHIPQTHYLEAWGDAKAFDGTCSLIQPLIAPLYDGKSAHEILDALANPERVRSDYEIVRGHWQSESQWPDFEKGWRVRCMRA